jgi:predicted Zn-dependent peptidase
MELLLESVFPLKELEQLKSIYLQNMKVNREKTSYLATTLFRKNIFGESHPYGRDLEDEVVKDLQQSHVIEHFHDHFRASTILISGNVSQEHQRAIVEMMAPFRFHPMLEPTGTGSQNFKPYREVVEKEGSVQSSIRMGKPSISRSHPDYADVLFLNHVLGGYFGSRLMKNIREDKGLTYGISSSLHTMAMESYLVIGADVNRDKLTVTFEEIRKELRRLREEKIGISELETAQNHFIGSLQLEVTTSFDHADKMKNIIQFNLPLDFYQRLISRVDQITGDDLLRVADGYFHEDTLMEVAVG